MSQDIVQTLQVLRRNSLTWDDDRKAAAFVSANDPTAVKFAKNVQSMVQGKAARPSSRTCCSPWRSTTRSPCTG